MTPAYRQALKHPRVWFVIGLAWTAIIVYGCFAPSQPNVGVDGFDKVLHFGAFAGLALWFGSIYEKKRHWRIAQILALLGVLIEIGQDQVSYRSSDFYDFLADVAGITVGILLARSRLARALRYVEARISS